MNKKQFEEKLGDRVVYEWITTEVAVLSKIKNRTRIKNKITQLKGLCVFKNIVQKYTKNIGVKNIGQNNAIQCFFMSQITEKSFYI